jgi:hypothetical protein
MKRAVQQHQPEDKYPQVRACYSAISLAICNNGRLSQRHLIARTDVKDL